MVTISSNRIGSCNDNIKKIYDDSKISDDTIIEFEKLFKEVFQDIRDEKIEINMSNNYYSYLFDFSKGPICNSDHAIFIENKIYQELFITIKFYNKSFNIGELNIDDLLFLESYIKDELSLNINYLSTFDGCYYKEVKYLPSDKLIDMLSINLIIKS